MGPPNHAGDPRRGGWRQLGVYYMPIQSMEDAAYCVESKDVRQGSVPVAPLNHPFPAMLKNDIPRIVSMTIIDKSLLRQ
jgi:hypothetical protein